MSERKPHASRFVVGIDLGTTNTVVAYADARHTQSAQAAQNAQTARTTHDEPAQAPLVRPRIEVLRVPQLVAPGEVSALPALPSFRYHPGDAELSDAELEVGLSSSLTGLPRGLGGTLAQTLGTRVPGRLISSAKSWLCHPAVDRHAPILPWGAAEDVAKISPVQASASYLDHVRAAWDAAHPSDPLSEQEVVLTVPASFDDAARALTLTAARDAGLPRVRLLEEPQAAFYDWLDRHHETLESDLSPVRLALVIDVGGGTTDLTLIAVELRESGPRLTRIAVGDHILLGGDNMDHTLARACEAALAGGHADAKLPAGRFAQLLQQCRQAKEQLLSQGAPESLPITLLGGGSKIVAGRQSTTLTRAQVQQAVVEGFFPRVELGAQPQARRSGLVEFGLPFAADPVITRHVAAFLVRNRAQIAEALGLSAEEAQAQSQRLLPDVVLFNGGVFLGAALQARMLEVLADFRGEPVRQLDNPAPELAVGRGAVAYGLARRGLGLKIGGGSPRSYYLLVEQAQAQHDRGVCVLPRGADEGEEFTLKERSFALRTGQPVRFRLLTSTRELRHRAGELVTLDGSYDALPEIAAVIAAKQAQPQELQVQLHAQLTEVGTLEMSLVSTSDPSQRYQLEFQLRGEPAKGQELQPARVTHAHPRLPQAAELIAAYYGKSVKELEGKKIKTLRADLERILGERESWDTALLRELFGKLLSGSKRRRRSADHERLWFHLGGYCLRPGFGYPVDAWRVEQLWPLYEEGVQFVQDAANWSQFWILWRRVAGGLSEAQQTRIADDLAPYLQPIDPRRKTRIKGPRAQGLEDMVRLAGSLERLPAARKLELGNWLLARLDKQELSAASVYWSLGRLGARAPWYGSAHTVIAPEAATAWLDKLLSLDLRKAEQAAFAVAQLARYTHDRARDLDGALRERAAQALAAISGSEAWVTLVRQGGELGESEVGRVFGDSLPSGLRLL